MRQQQRQRDPKPIKEQLRERIHGHFSFPETITEGWEKEDVLVAFGELLDESQIKFTWGLRKYRALIVTLLIVYLPLVGWMFLQHKYRFIATQWFTIPLATALCGRVFQKKTPPSSSLPQQQVKLVQVLSALLVRVNEVRFVPHIIEAARRVPELPVGRLNAYT